MIGCLLLHGFTGSPYEVQPLADYLRDHTDWLVRTPTLPGHGETLQLKGVAYTQWVEHAEEELKYMLSLCSEVYLVGFSMGGLLASYLASKHPVKKLVLLSAAAYYMNPKQLFKDIREMLRDSFSGKLKENELYLRYRKKIVETPISAALQFRRIVSLTRPLLGHIKAPVLIVQGECDGIVPVKSARFLYENIGSPLKKICFLPKAKHHVCHSEDKDTLIQEVFRFLH